MKVIEIEKTQFTPSIILNKEKSIFKLEGISLPENSLEFYNPILDWFNEYSENPNHQTHVEINLIYLNSSTALIISRILQILKKIIEQTNTDVLIKWYFNKDDLKISENGAELQQLFSIPFEFIQIEDE